MKFNLLNEPELVFGGGKHICPKTGITDYSVYDINFKARKTDFLLGIVGLEEDIEKLNDWLKVCEGFISAEDSDKQNISFPGFNRNTGFKSSFQYSSEISRMLSLSTLKEILREPNRNKRISDAVNEFYKQCKFLSEDKKVDIIICIIPKIFEDKIVKDRNDFSVEENIEEESDTKKIETNFRRALKAKCLQFDSPIQIIREYVLSESKKIQDRATIAWNFSIGIYYKAMQTVPWKLDRDSNLPPACYVGISFYRSRDRTTLQTSLAQIFNENGNGIILRGSPVSKDKDDRIPHLNYDEAYDLLFKTLEHYKFALSTIPGRLVLHKTSKFYEDELHGFEAAAKEFGVIAYDIINIQETDIRLFRNGLYPPHRGSMITIDDTKILLYTRGSMEYYRTYPGMYIPAPLLINIVKSASSHRTISNEILGLTKMNWNNAQIDGKYPITIGCSRKVGEIMKYLNETDKPKTKYAYYM
ncbi:MAG: hypothetical protein HND52_15140 [Ignavibacteriae bacterium]|nr:hypothetical protein [Ignavibacteriota bacterium]NOG99290.1 hypothetical protein [Ignavibacteriota bacterium]